MPDSAAQPLAGSPWSVFGYDLRQLSRQWVSAWRDFLFSVSSPIRARLDEPVLLHTPGGQRLYQGGGATEASGEAPRCHAIEVPESLFLARTVSIPAVAEAELASVLGMEIAANSPFTAEDTLSGWREISRTADTLHIAFAVAARSTLAQWLATQPGVDAGDAPELWAAHGGEWIVLRGFGEALREGLYRARLVRMGGLLAATLAALYIIAGLYVAQQRIALDRLEAKQRTVAAQTVDVSRQRQTLLAANAAIAAANAVVGAFPNPHVELARLTELLGDDAYLAHFSARGRTLQVRGRAVDAAQVMQSLAEQPAFASVTAPQAITAVSNTGVEQFYLDIQLSETKSTEIKSTETKSSETQAAEIRATDIQAVDDGAGVAP